MSSSEWICSFIIHYAQSESLYQSQRMNNTCTCIYNMVGVDYFDFMVNEKGKTKFV
jgi:hypothetical protein